jgi:heptosyltransferase-2
VKKILLSCTLAIGDVVMATAAAALLKKIYPGVEISFMVKQLAEEIVQNNPVIDEVIAPAYEQKKLSAKLMMELTGELKAKKFDLFISLDGKPRPALLAWLAGIPIRVGPTRIFGSNTKLPLVFTHNIAVSDFRTTHYIDVLHELIGKFTGSDLKAGPVLPTVTAEDAAEADKLLAGLGRHEYTIGLCVKSNPLKTWPQERFAELISKLAAKYEAGFYIIGGWYDKEYVEELIALSGVPVANYCGTTTLHQLIGLLNKTDAFISLDTAPMHIASVLDTPMVAIFGPTAVVSVAPLSPKAVILAPGPGLACLPCIPNRVQIFPGVQKRIAAGTCQEHACMKAITVDMVEAAAKEIIASVRQERG